MKKHILIAGLLLLFAIVHSQPTTFNYHGLGGGGGQYAPSINPANPAEIYVACDMSGLYHSTDTGNTWNLIGFQQVQAGHPSMVQFTNNPNIRYCMTLETAMLQSLPMEEIPGPELQMLPEEMVPGLLMRTRRTLIRSSCQVTPIFISPMMVAALSVQPFILIRQVQVHTSPGHFLTGRISISAPI